MARDAAIYGDCPMSGLCPLMTFVIAGRGRGAHPFGAMDDTALVTKTLDMSALEPLLARRQQFLGAWREVCELELGPMLELESKDFDGVFERELERLHDPEVTHSPGLLEATLQATATCLVRRGVPLSHLLAMCAYSGHAAGVALGQSLPAETLRALNELEAVRAGAYARAYQVHAEPSRPRLGQPLVPLRRASSDRPAAKDHGIVGTSAAVRKLRGLVEMASQGASNVLIVGEAGTGKELVARAIHEEAGGSRARFVVVRCSELPNHLVESELFGHVRGAFPGASAEYAGLLRGASGGTLFLEELTELSPEIQAKLLRVLEQKAVTPVGSSTEIPVDVRVIASTARDPATAVSAGQLRPDLYYQLQSLTIDVPPLRDRREDIPLLAEHFLASFCHRRCGCIWGLSQRALEVLMTAEWPGNIRELRSAIEHGVSNGESGLIQVTDLPEYLRGGIRQEDSRADASSSDLPSLAEAEAQLIRATLEHFGGNKVRAAHSLGISRHKLYDRLRKLGIQ